MLDVFVPIPVQFLERWRHGLYIEFKRPKYRNVARGGMSEAQVDFGKAMLEQGYAVELAYTWREGILAVRKYLRYDGHDLDAAPETA